MSGVGVVSCVASCDAWSLDALSVGGTDDSMVVLRYLFFGGDNELILIPASSDWT